MRKLWSVATIVFCLVCLLLLGIDALKPDMVLYSNRFVKYYTCLACAFAWVNGVICISYNRKKRRKALARKEKARRKAA